VLLVFHVLLYKPHKCQGTRLKSIPSMCQLLFVASEPFGIQTNVKITGSIGLQMSLNVTGSMKVVLCLLEKKGFIYMWKKYIYILCHLDIGLERIC
jgi:hypothetical protein